MSNEILALLSQRIPNDVAKYIVLPQCGEYCELHNAIGCCKKCPFCSMIVDESLFLPGDELCMVCLGKACRICGKVKELDSKKYCEECFLETCQKCHAYKGEHVMFCTTCLTSFLSDYHLCDCGLQLENFDEWKEFSYYGVCQHRFD